MKTKRKALTLAFCAMILVGATFLGTLAYLTDSEAVTNTFTVGQVGLSLDEAKVNEMGEVQKDKDNNEIRWTPTENDPKQEYHLIPGLTYIKDPTVTVDANSENCYVRMMVTISYKNAADKVFADHTTGNMMEPWLNIDTANWTVNGAPKTVETDTTTTRTYEFRYKDVVTKSATATKLPALFTTLTVPGLVTNEEIAHLEDMEISVTAHAIQSAGFDDADAAWGAWK